MKSINQITEDQIGQRAYIVTGRFIEDQIVLALCPEDAIIIAAREHGFDYLNSSRFRGEMQRCVFGHSITYTNSDGRQETEMAARMKGASSSLHASPIEILIS